MTRAYVTACCILAAITATAQTATLGDLKRSNKVVTNELDTAGKAYTLAVSNTLATVIGAVEEAYAGSYLSRVANLDGASTNQTLKDSMLDIEGAITNTVTYINSIALATTAGAIATEAATRSLADVANSAHIANNSNRITSANAAIAATSNGLVSASAQIGTNRTHIASLSNGLVSANANIVNTSNSVVTLDAKLVATSNVLMQAIGSGITAPEGTNIAQAVIAPYTNSIATAWQNSGWVAMYEYTENAFDVVITKALVGFETMYIPEMINGKPVRELAGYYKTDVDAVVGVFYDYNSIKNVFAPSVSRLGNRAFYMCSSVEKIHIENVESINPTNLFRDCTSLNSVYWSKNNTSPEDYLFVAIPANQVTNYVANPTATGWGSTFGGMPVVRMPIESDSVNAGTTITIGDTSSGTFTLGGSTIASWPTTSETVVTGAVVRVSAGNRYFFTTPSNVVLSASLTAGQVVNYVAIRNTTNAPITAVAETSAWVWTGGSMTNTIPTNSMMTFGFACNPITGKTNAYATAASVN